MQYLIDIIRKFRDDRNWSQFHTGGNLAKSLSIEASEVLQLFQWKDECDSIDDLRDEVADVMIYALLLCERYDFNPEEIIKNKITKNEKKYPIEKAFGKSDKYNKL
jgi:NTP pyrophosphatase (non-canonical NTP hydrolase)